MALRVAATWTAAWCSSALAGELGGLRVGVDAWSRRRAARRCASRSAAKPVALDGARAVAAASARPSARVEVDVHPLVAGRVRVGEVAGQRRLAQGGARDGALERELGGVEQHGDGFLSGKDLVRPWTAHVAGSVATALSDRRGRRRT